MNHLKVKDGVWIPHLHRNMVRAIPHILDAFEHHGYETVLTEAYATSGHMVNSKHYENPCAATDWRTWTSPTSGVQIDKETKHKIAETIRLKLGRKYDVAVEWSHIHIEWDE